jgi:hypothetical protein
MTALIRVHQLRRPAAPLRNPYAATSRDKKKAREKSPAFIVWGVVNALIVHTAHTAHATAGHGGGRIFLLRSFGDHGFGGDQKPGDRRCILKRRPHNLGWVDDTLADEIDVLEVLGVEAV